MGLAFPARCPCFSSTFFGPSSPWRPACGEWHTLRILSTPSSSTFLVVGHLSSWTGRPVTATVLVLRMAAVTVNWATISFGAISTGYAFSKSCLEHSLSVHQGQYWMAILAVISSSKCRRLKHSAG